MLTAWLHFEYNVCCTFHICDNNKIVWIISAGGGVVIRDSRLCPGLRTNFSRAIGIGITYVTPLAHVL
jgi:hypothetical protein